MPNRLTWDNWISIHALRVEGDASVYTSGANCVPFLSTPSVWRATQTVAPTNGWAVDFYPRPPCGGRRAAARRQGVGRCISIHALRVEGDALASTAMAPSSSFLSTPSVWRATGRNIPGAPRRAYFYPRPPCGGRPVFTLGDGKAI